MRDELDAGPSPPRCRPSGTRPFGTAPDPFRTAPGFAEPLLAYDEAHAGRAAAADVQGLEGLGSLDLKVARSAGDLIVGVQQLAHACRTDRVTGADQAAARVDRYLAIDLEPALASTAFQLSPGFVMPKWSIAMYSEVVKQS